LPASLAIVAVVRIASLTRVLALKLRHKSEVRKLVHQV
jgi:hypothetical protein